VLFTYLLSHFLNHALGNISLDALQWGVEVHSAFWQFLPIALLFYAAVAAHGGLGIWALYERRQFHWKTIEPLQLLLGLSIPLLIVSHVVAVRLGWTLYQQEKLYPQALYAYWVAWPARKWLMFLVILVSWIHGCIGLYFWLRMRSWFKTAAPWLLAAAVLVPTLAMLGLYQSGRIVAEISAAPQWQAAHLGPRNLGTPDQQQTLERIVDAFIIGYLGLIALALIARGIRALNERRRGAILLSYGSERTIRVPKGLSVLEASLRFNIPHASICGGRARCSTCRIRVIGDHHALPPPSAREAFVLARVGAGNDPAIRLACQLRPEQDLAFFQIFQPQGNPAQRGTPARIGQERYLVSMFIDMRGSTRLAESRLPFDTVFIINRFLSAIAKAVIACGGQPNQFVGDGQLALFGLEAGPQQASRQALRAAAMIASNIDALNRFLGDDLSEPLRFGIGIHAGEVIIGEIGYRDHMVFTALGDAVNVAARLQELSKELQCELVLSDDVRTMAGLPADLMQKQDVAIRGRSEPMAVYTFGRAAELATLHPGLAE
jgi:adenylate cyclase